MENMDNLEAFIIKKPEWVKAAYSKERIEEAGREIIDEELSEEDKKNALLVIDNWRTAHILPVKVIYTTLKRMASGDNRILVAQRLKRLDSIVGKLKRFNTMTLWEMQDLGGCRFITSSVDDVYKYSKKFDGSRVRHTLKKVNDYISAPKESGYRSLHMIYEYHSDKSDKFNKDILIEIQFRTYLQHLWATAVETMGMFTNEAIKSGKGSQDVTRFFALVSSLFALRENTPIVPGTPDNVDEIVREIKSLDDYNNYLDFLANIKVIAKYEESKKYYGNDEYSVLSLNYETGRMNIKRFRPCDVDKANEYYIELENMNNNKTDTVLVRVSSFSALQSAYPNYFADINEFVDIVKDYLEEK